jgi:hypothetical protein
MSVHDDPELSGGKLIKLERQRQKRAEGYTAEDDSAHDGDELISAAIAYCDHAIDPSPEVPECWPFERALFKPKDRRRDLIRAGALIAAELDRLSMEG